jgi:hypothetical protein
LKRKGLGVNSSTALQDLAATHPRCWLRARQEQCERNCLRLAPQAFLRGQVATVDNKVGTAENGEAVQILGRDRRFARVPFWILFLFPLNQNDFRLETHSWSVLSTENFTCSGR